MINLYLCDICKFCYQKKGGKTGTNLITILAANATLKTVTSIWAM